MRRATQMDVKQLYIFLKIHGPASPVRGSNATACIFRYMRCPRQPDSPFHYAGQIRGTGSRTLALHACRHAAAPGSLSRFVIARAPDSRNPTSLHMPVAGISRGLKRNVYTCGGWKETQKSRRILESCAESAKHGPHRPAELFHTAGVSRWRPRQKARPQ